MELTTLSKKRMEMWFESGEIYSPFVLLNNSIRIEIEQNYDAYGLSHTISALGYTEQLDIKKSFDDLVCKVDQFAQIASKIKTHQESQRVPI